MKKAIILLAVFLVPVVALALDPGGKISKRKVSSVISQYRGKQGVEVVDLGYIGTSLIKSLASFSSDKEDKDALMLLKGLKGITVFSYEDATAELKKKINSHLEKILKEAEILMEAKEEGETMRIYGTYNEKTGKVSDVAMFSPTEGTFVYLVGSFNMDEITKAMAND